MYTGEALTPREATLASLVRLQWHLKPLGSLQLQKTFPSVHRLLRSRYIPRWLVFHSVRLLGTPVSRSYRCRRSAISQLDWLSMSPTPQCNCELQRPELQSKTLVFCLACLSEISSCHLCSVSMLKPKRGTGNKSRVYGSGVISWMASCSSATQRYMQQKCKGL